MELIQKLPWNYTKLDHIFNTNWRATCSEDGRGFALRDSRLVFSSKIDGGTISHFLPQRHASTVAQHLSVNQAAFLLSFSG